MFFPLRDRHNPHQNRWPIASLTVLAVNLLVFGYQLLLDEGAAPLETDLFILRYGFSPNAIGEPGYLFSLVSYTFLHGSGIHLLGNLWFFWIFANNVEWLMGTGRFIVFYLAVGIAAALFHSLLAMNPLIGASGAVAGIMGAYIVLFPGNRITCYFCPIWFFIRRLDVPAWIVLGFYLFFQAFAFWHSEFLKTHIAFDSHLGGFLAGILIGWFFREREPDDLLGHHQGKDHHIGENQRV